jgi:hypothetical protein
MDNGTTLNRRHHTLEVTAIGQSAHVHRFACTVVSEQLLYCSGIEGVRDREFWNEVYDTGNSSRRG